MTVVLKCVWEVQKRWRQVFPLTPSCPYWREPESLSKIKSNQFGSRGGNVFMNWEMSTWLPSQLKWPQTTTRKNDFECCCSTALLQPAEKTLSSLWPPLLPQFHIHRHSQWAGYTRERGRKDQLHRCYRWRCRNRKRRIGIMMGAWQLIGGDYEQRESYGLYTFVLHAGDG